MSKLDFNDSQMDVLVKMADGNPGAVGALTEILTKGDEIDPQSFSGGLGAILLLDSWGIYGSDIYVLWSDKCGKDVRKMLMLMRSCQLGNFCEWKLKEMAADQFRAINLSVEEWQAHDDFVCGKLEQFQKAA